MPSAAFLSSLSLSSRQRHVVISSWVLKCSNSVKLAMDRIYLYNVFGQPGVSITTNGDELLVAVKPILVNFTPFFERIQQWFKVSKSDIPNQYAFNFTLHVTPQQRKAAIEIIGGIYADTQKI